MASRNLLEDTLVALADANVGFVVCGGVASILQGVQRATHDLDLRVRLQDHDLAGVVAVAQALGFQPRIPEPLSALLDVERRRVWTDEGRAIRVSSKRDLIVAKQAVQPPRKTDLRDIADLQELLDEQR
jgi:hypothetical protein